LKKNRKQGTFEREKSKKNCTNKLKKIQQKKIYIKKLKNLTKQILHSEMDHQITGALPPGTTPNPPGPPWRGERRGEERGADAAALLARSAMGHM